MENEIMDKAETTGTALDLIEDKPLAKMEHSSIETIVCQAIQSGRTGAELKEFLDFARELRASKAQAVFNAALAQFKRNCPRITRRTDNPQFTVTRNGVKRPSRFASLADISEAIDGPLGEVGLSYGWTDADVKSEPGKMILGCIISHAGGHVASPKFVTYPMDTAGAGSSPQQKTASVTSYCMRYSLKIALGLTDVDDDDDDGNSGGEPAATITEAQQNTLNDLILEVFADRGKFLKYMGVNQLADILANRFDQAVQALESKRKGKA